jgi:hypothetical protein
LWQFSAGVIITLPLINVHKIFKIYYKVVAFNFLKIENGCTIDFFFNSNFKEHRKLHTFVCIVTFHEIIERSVPAKTARVCRLVASNIYAFTYFTLTQLNSQ